VELPPIDIDSYDDVLNDPDFAPEESEEDEGFGDWLFDSLAVPRYFVVLTIVMLLIAGFMLGMVTTAHIAIDADRRHWHHERGFRE